jgi:isoquinoline 1-oxidoreductase alpha subunit
MNSWQLRVNGEQREVTAEEDTPLLWILREHLRLTGTKFGCGLGQCGACTVHLDGAAVRSCQIKISEAAGHEVTTIEGLKGSHPVQRAWVEEQVPQCGYCQPGFIMAVSALLARNPSPSRAEVLSEVTNLCRCGTYLRILRAIDKASHLQARSHVE